MFKKQSNGDVRLSNAKGSEASSQFRYFAVAEIEIQFCVPILGLW